MAPIQFEQAWSMRTGATNCVNCGKVIGEQGLGDGLLESGPESVGERLHDLGKMLRHHVLGRGVNEIARQTDGFHLPAHALTVDLRVETEFGDRKILFLVTVEPVPRQSPSERNGFTLCH